jgi:hypothetical protein
MKLYVCPEWMTGDDRLALAELTWWSTASEFVQVIDSVKGRRRDDSDGATRLPLWCDQRVGSGC